MSTLDYILGDPNEKRAQEKQDEDKLKKQRQEKEMEEATKKKRLQEEKRKEMKAKLDAQRKLKASRFGNFVTINFLMFAIMHISLSLDQYNVGKMNEFGTATSYAFLPNIDLSKAVAAMQFINRE